MSASQCPFGAKVGRRGFQTSHSPATQGENYKPSFGALLASAIAVTEERTLPHRYLATGGAAG